MAQPASGGGAGLREVLLDECLGLRLERDAAEPCAHGVHRAAYAGLAVARVAGTQQVAPEQLVGRVESQACLGRRRGTTRVVVAGEEVHQPVGGRDHHAADNPLQVVVGTQP